MSKKRTSLSSTLHQFNPSKPVTSGRSPGSNPLMLFSVNITSLKHFDGLNIVSIQSDCLKISVA